MISLFPSPVLANRIARNLTHEILAIVQLKGDLRDNVVLKFWLYILLLGDIIHQLKWKKIKTNILIGSIWKGSPSHQIWALNSLI